MLNAAKPVHLNLSLSSGVAAGATSSIYTYEDVPDGTVALRVTIPGMGASADPPSGQRSTWRKASWIWLRNMDATNDVAVSFDNGNNFMTVNAAVAAAGVFDTFQASLSFRHFFIKAAAGNPVLVECIVGINGPN
jgi:hypothetical protein